MSESQNRRAEQARRNGRLSRGPKTAAGKAVSRFNALSHGLTAKTVVLPGEFEERFNLILEGLHAEHAPQSITESLLVEQLAASAWRLRRSLGFERALLAHDRDQQGPAPDPETRAALAFASSGRAHLLARYEAHVHRMFTQSLRELHLRQTEEIALDEDPFLRNEPNAEDSAR